MARARTAAGYSDAPSLARGTAQGQGLNSTAQGSSRKLLCLVVCLLFELCVAQIDVSPTAAGACGPSLVMLPSSPDPNTDVLFNMQTRKMEEALYIASESGRSLVEPYYVFGARNWTWFEDGNHNQLSRNEDIHAGMLGTIEEPLSSFFDLAPLHHVVHRPVVPLSSYVATCGRELDVVVRFYGHNGMAHCDDGHSGEEPWSAGEASSLSAWGVDWTVLRILCVHSAHVTSVAQLLEMSQSALRLGVQYLPAKFVEQRRAGWRWSPERARIRAALVWAAPLVRQAEDFIASHLAPLDGPGGAQAAATGAADASATGRLPPGSPSPFPLLLPLPPPLVPTLPFTDLDARYGAVLAGVSSDEIVADEALATPRALAGLGDFVAVHWRRGDRGYQEEMGIHGHVDVALTSPLRMVQYVQEVVSGLQDIVDDSQAGSAGVSGIFLATNCGNEGHLNYVTENLGATRLPVALALSSLCVCERVGE